MLKEGEKVRVTEGPWGHRDEEELLLTSLTSQKSG